MVLFVLFILVTTLVIGTPQYAKSSSFSDRELREQSLACGCVVKLELPGEVRYYMVGNLREGGYGSLGTQSFDAYFNRLIEIIDAIFDRKNGQQDQDLLNEYLTIVSHDPTLVTMGGAFFLGKIYGNTLIAAFENIPLLDPKRILDFYDGYIGSHTSPELGSFPSRETHPPTDKNKLNVIRKLQELMAVNPDYKNHVISSTTQDEVRRLAPDVYNSLWGK